MPYMGLQYCPDYDIMVMSKCCLVVAFLFVVEEKRSCKNGLFSFPGFSATGSEVGGGIKIVH